MSNPKRPKKGDKEVAAPPAPVISKIPLEVSDSPLVIDLPDGQKLVVGKMIQGTVIEVATWRGTGRPDSRTSRLMLGMSVEDAAPKTAAKVDEPTSTSAPVTNPDGSVSVPPAAAKSFTQEWLEYIAHKVPALAFLAKIKVPAIKIPAIKLPALGKPTRGPKQTKQSKPAGTIAGSKAKSLISGEKKSLPAIAPDTESDEISAWLDQIAAKARTKSAKELESAPTEKSTMPSPFDRPAQRSQTAKKASQKASKSPKKR